MSKVDIGDYVFVDYLRKNGTVIGDRGGHVGRWTVKFDDGEVGHCSARDCTVIKYANRPVKNVGYLTTDEKLDLLMDYLGVEIQIQNPAVVKRESSSPRSKSNNKDIDNE